MKTQGERIQKILARGGYGSRREIEKWIEEGLISINGRTATLGDRATPEDNLMFRGNKVRTSRMTQQPTKVLLYHKPDGLVTSRSDEKGRDTIFSQLPFLPNGRWISIGRLDLNTSGLLLVTNNGELANRLMHPSYEVEREYAVRVFGEVTKEMLNNLRKGVKLEDGVARFSKVFALPSDEEAINKWYGSILSEGKYREVRRLWESQGVQVSRLIRTRYAGVTLPRDLPRGKHRELTWREVNVLLRKVDLPEENRPDLRRTEGNFKNSSVGRGVAKPDSKKTSRRPKSGPRPSRPNNRRS